MAGLPNELNILQVKTVMITVQLRSVALKNLFLNVSSISAQSFANTGSFNITRPPPIYWLWCVYRLSFVQKEIGRRERWPLTKLTLTNKTGSMCQ